MLRAFLRVHNRRYGMVVNRRKEVLKRTAQMKCDTNHKKPIVPVAEEVMHQQATRKLAPWVTLTCTLVAFGCGDAATGPDPNPDPNPQLGDVSVTSAVDLVLAVGYTVQLNATVTNTDGSVVSGAALTWQTSDADVAIVDGGGLVTGIGAGQATITATYNSLGGSVPITILDADLDAISRLRDDPLVTLLIDRLDGDLATQLTMALNDMDAAVTVGHCLAVQDALESALANIGGSTSPDDVVSLAVLGLVIERAQSLLGL
jgi:hypothetical protein